MGFYNFLKLRALLQTFNTVILSQLPCSQGLVKSERRNSMQFLFFFFFFLKIQQCVYGHRRAQSTNKKTYVVGKETSSFSRHKFFCVIFKLTAFTVSLQSSNQASYSVGITLKISHITSDMTHFTNIYKVQCNQFYINPT